MKKVYWKNSFLVSLMLMLALVVGACAYDQAGVVTEPSTVGEADVVQEDAAVEAVEPGAQDDVMMLASALLNREVENPAEEQLGNLNDFVIDLSTGNVLFALIEHGGFLDIGDDDIAVPMSALAIGPANDELILNVPEEVFDIYPDVDIDQAWGTGLDTTWDDEIGPFWTDAGYDMTVLDNVDPNMVVRADNMVGYGVGTYNTTGLANTEDMIVDLGTGQVEYAVLSFNDVGLYGEDWIVVPWEAFDPTGFGNEFVFDQNFDTTLLETAPRISATDMTGTDVFEPGWDTDVRTYWEDQGLTY